MVLGGLGIFLLAMRMLTDGLRQAAGEALREILARSTRTPLRGVVSGLTVTALVQSSGVVTVAIIGFVNAGLMSLGQALGVVYGANIGTTFTGWLVTAVGMGPDVEALALPLVGIGMLMRLFRRQTRISGAGEALAGFGLFFLGIQVLTTAFEGAAAGIDLSTLSPRGPAGMVLCLVIGAGMTVLTQSSSAAIAITLTAVTGGLLPLEPAAAIVIGSNVGSTSTAVFASIDATSSARRVAAAHVLFNLVTGLVALLILPLMLWSVGAFERLLDMEPMPAVSLALFHTIFNVLGVLLMLPLSARLNRFLEQRFVTSAERLGRPRHLDRSVVDTPSLALDALILELTRLLTLARDWVGDRLGSDHVPPRDLEARREAITSLGDEVLAFLARLEQGALSEGVTTRLPVVLRILDYIDDAMEQAVSAAQQDAALEALIERGDVGEQVAIFRGRALALVAASDPERIDHDPAVQARSFEELTDDWHGLKDALLQAGIAGQVPLRQVSPGLEALRYRMHLAGQFTKAAARLRSLGLQHPPPDGRVAAEEAAPGTEGASAADPEQRDTA
jgi:phosphate:Na+ symporter